MTLYETESQLMSDSSLPAILSTLYYQAESTFWNGFVLAASGTPVILFLEETYTQSSRKFFLRTVIQRLELQYHFHKRFPDASCDRLHFSYQTDV